MQKAYRENLYKKRTASQMVFVFLFAIFFSTALASSCQGAGFSMSNIATSSWSCQEREITSSASPLLLDVLAVTTVPNRFTILGFLLLTFWTLTWRDLRRIPTFPLRHQMQAQKARDKLLRWVQKKGMPFANLDGFLSYFAPVRDP